MENLNSIFFYHLDKAIKTYRQYAQAILKEKGFDITIDQWMVLKAIDDNADISQNELAELVFKDKASVTRIIDVLVGDKYLKREIHPGSKRRNQLQVSDKGERLLRSIRPTVLKNRKHALKGISESNLRISEEVLITIAKNCKKS